MKRILPLTLALALLLTGCAGPGAPDRGDIPPSPTPSPSTELGDIPPQPAVPDWEAYSLAEAMYPAFPSYPDTPKDGEGWGAYFAAEQGYL